MAEAPNGTTFGKQGGDLGGALASEARGQLGAAAHEIKAKVGDKAEELAARGTRAGADTVAAIGKTAETLASSLQDQSPAVADYVRSTGARIDRLADDLRDKSAGELLGMATEFGKKQPLVLLAGAAVVGFALSRVVKAGLVTDKPNDAPSDGRSDA
ncbi:MAG: hypothetical protein EPO67_19465 [Reyranella sp.]|nr:MAG: hypothetical protein EPO67_19465 [Reyranella sp.]